MIGLLLACREPEPVAFAAEATFSELVPTVLRVTWDVPAGARYHVAYGRDGALDHVTPQATANVASTVTVPVLGLAASGRYAWRAVVVDADGERTTPTAEVEVPPAPDGFATLSVEADPSRSEAATGYTLLSITDFLTAGDDAQSYVAIVSGAGEYVWWQALEAGRVSISPSFDPYLPAVLWDEYPVADELDASAVELRLDGSRVTETAIPNAHHVVVPTGPGQLAYIAADFHEVDGRQILTDRIDEREGLAFRTVSALFDQHFGGSFDGGCIHSRLPREIGGQSGVREWTHGNSLVYLPALDDYFLYARWIDALFRIDRATGDIVWQMGGDGGDFRLPDGTDPWTSPADSALWSHGHLSHLWDGGLVAFDNGDHRVPQVPAIVELAWDDASATVEEVFRYERPDGTPNLVLGDARKLPGGNYLAVWSQAGTVSEITLDGDEVWTLVVDDGRAVTRVQWTPDLYDTAPLAGR